MESDKLTVGIVGKLQKYKGILDIVEAIRMCPNKDITFLFIGEVPSLKEPLAKIISRWMGLNHDVSAKMLKRIYKYGLNKRVSFRPHTIDIKSAYRDIDVLCFVSHLEAVGRPVIEAALLGIPSIVALTKSYDDVVIDGVTGIIVKLHAPMQIANVIIYLYHHRDMLHRMGVAAYKHAKIQFDVDVNTKKVLRLYRKCLGDRYY